MALIDEALVNVTSGRVAPQVSGMAYCAMISMCMQRFDVERAGEWTIALSDWCEAQAGLVPYRGICRLHRAEILQLRGSWDAAAGEAEQLTGPPPPPGSVGGAAHYRLAELYRLRGRFDLAERSYAAAAACGQEVQPGLALLRLAQGRPAAGIAGLDRALAEAAPDADRPRLLAARAELAIDAKDLDGARLASSELAELAERTPMPYVVALAAHAGGLDPTGRRRPAGRVASVPPVLVGLAAGRRPVRGRTGPDAGGSGLPGAGRRGRRADGAGRGAYGAAAARRAGRPAPDRPAPTP